MVARDDGIGAKADGGVVGVLVLALAARRAAGARSRPTMRRSSVPRSKSPRASVPVTAPSRSTTTRSAIRSTSSRWWDTNTTAVPRARRSAMMASSRSTSGAVRLEVGSSRMRMRAFAESALAISTSCRCAMGSAPHGVAGSMCRPTVDSQRRASSRMARRFRKPAVRGSRPRKMLPATSRFSARLSSWWTSAMPASASATFSEPSLGATTPESSLSSVLFPAPFSPTIASTSPPRMSRSTPRSAETPA
jgi:hypothetical protein